jgi:hypothetical protein
MWVLFVFILLLEVFLAFSKSQIKTCVNKDKNALYLLLLHHVGNCFLLYGWLFSNKVILLLHIFTVIGTAIYWKVNNNRCDLTIYINRECGFPENAPFHDLLDMSGLKSVPMWNEIGHYIFIVLGCLISVYKFSK